MSISNPPDFAAPVHRLVRRLRWLVGWKDCNRSASIGPSRTFYEVRGVEHRVSLRYGGACFQVVSLGQVDNDDPLLRWNIDESIAENTFNEVRQINVRLVTYVSASVAPWVDVLESPGNLAQAVLYRVDPPVVVFWTIHLFFDVGENGSGCGMSTLTWCDASGHASAYVSAANDGGNPAAADNR